MPISVSVGNRRNIASECPPRPSVASTTMALGREMEGSRRDMHRSSSTGVCFTMPSFPFRPPDGGSPHALWVLPSPAVRSDPPPSSAPGEVGLTTGGDRNARLHRRDDLAVELDEARFLRRQVCRPGGGIPDFDTCVCADNDTIAIESSEFT